MSKKAWIIFVVICAAILGGLIIISNKNKIDVSGVDANKIQSAAPQSGGIADHVFGKKDSKVVLVEYGDYQCPGCGNAFPKLKKISEEYKEHIAFVFRNFPLTSLHPNARVAAATAEAAGLQGKFWEMHDLLYENQSAWENLTSDKRTDFFVNYAGELKLDTARFKTDLVATNVNQKISYDQAIGKKIGVDATPSIFLNGKKLEQTEWSNEEALEKVIVAALKENNIALPETK